MRILCVDFETNGFASRAVPKHENPRPWANYPIQVSVDAVVDGEVVHLYDAFIRGATCLSRWTTENVSVTMKQLRAEGKPWWQVQDDLNKLVEEGDVVASHNAEFDMERVYGSMLSKHDLEVYDDYGGIDQIAAKLNRERRKMYYLPRICTMMDVFSKTAFDGKKPTLQNLCACLDVDLLNAHDARADSKALAQCVAKAHRNGVVWQLRHKQIPDSFEDVSDEDAMVPAQQKRDAVTAACAAACATAVTRADTQAHASTEMNDAAADGASDDAVAGATASLTLVDRARMRQAQRSTSDQPTQ